MDCNSIQPFPTRRQFAWYTTRARLAAVCCAVLIVIPLLNDLFRPHINLTILYLLPMVFCAWIGQRRLLRKVLLLCVVLTYLGLGVRMWMQPGPYWVWALVNRTFIVIALIICGYLLELMLTNLLHRASWRSMGVDAEQVLIEEVIFSAQCFAAIFATLVLAVGVFILDLVTPGQLNCPILYSVPLLMIIWTRSHVWLWSLVGLLIILAVVGWFVGPAPTTAPNLLTVLMTNRFVAICVLLLFALIMHLATLPYSKGKP